MVNWDLVFVQLVKTDDSRAQIHHLMAHTIYQSVLTLTLVYPSSFSCIGFKLDECAIYAPKLQSKMEHVQCRASFFSLITRGVQ